MHFLSNALRRELLNNFNKGLPTFEMIENDKVPEVDENSYCHMKVEVNKDGHVKVKTASKEPGKEWDVKVEEYDKDPSTLIDQDKSQKKPALEHSKQEASGKKVADVAKGSEVQKSSMKKGEKGAELSKTEDPVHSEIQTMFDNIEKDFENSLKRNFGMMGDQAKSVFEKEGKASKSYQSPFEEMDAIFEKMERDFENTWKRSLGFYDPFFSRSSIEEMKQDEGQAKKVESKAGSEKLESKAESEKMEGSKKEEKKQASPTA